MAGTGEKVEQFSGSKYALDGIQMWLNNKPLEAEEYFRRRKTSLQVEAGYTFLSFLNAIISWETNKIEDTQKLLRDLEKHCTTDNGWLKTVRVKLFGSSQPAKTLAESLEEQIILADSQLCTSILTGLTQDMTGMMKAGWSLRKAWKLYQQSYSQISDLYRQTFQCNLHAASSKLDRAGSHRKEWKRTNTSSDDELDPPAFHSPNDSPSHCYDIPFPIEDDKTTQNGHTDNETDGAAATNTVNASQNGGGTGENGVASTSVATTATETIITSKPPSGATTVTATTSTAGSTNGATGGGSGGTGGGGSSSTSRMSKSFTTTFADTIQSMNSPSDGAGSHHHHEHHHHRQHNHESGSAVNNTSIPSSARLCKNSNSLDESLGAAAATATTNGFHKPPGMPQSFSMHDFDDRDRSFQHQRQHYTPNDIDKEDLKRLMGAASFGYGLFQLSVSLLPPNLLKLISFFGFEGDRRIGIACLKHSRQSEDMRAPLATLSLLWYYTIITPFFALDGTNLDTEIEEANILLEEAQDGYAEASLFLFFKGRVERLKSNIPNAIVSYETSHRVSVQREIKLLCLHEIGWCRLIQLDFGKAMDHFKELKQHSQFSKSFYAYMMTICQAAHGQFDDLVEARDEIYSFISSSYLKDFWDEYVLDQTPSNPNAVYLQDSQIEKYILRRVSKLPCEDTETEKFEQIYWKYLVYEMLVMWNALTSCSEESLKLIMEDCKKPRDQLNEPMKGLAKLILGNCHACLKNFDEAIIAYSECIEQRGELLDDLHISAFAHFELALLLLRHRNDKVEARRLLTHVQTNYRNYDFENRLGIRVHSILKSIS